ncbi:MAG: transcriptional regulator MraZ [Gammaproteobacteria bacterium]|nr:MAG: transcriptional regulator MraZ [Gammaproteobacteria bacterium]
MFRGINTINLDAKGRMAMPARYREQLIAIVLAILWLRLIPIIGVFFSIPFPNGNKSNGKSNHFQASTNSQRVKHLLIGHANDLELDSSGRILLPQELRFYAQLEKHVCLIGQGKKLEIWNQNSGTNNGSVADRIECRGRVTRKT